MRQSVDPKNLLSALHYQASGELMRLMDGFYSNIEDGLFELAYANEDKMQQRRTVELMRELRFRREHLLKTFGKRIQRSAKDWYEADMSAEYLEERAFSEQIAARCSGHFGTLLQSITERVSHATGNEIDRASVPLSPEQVSYQFVMSCRSLEFTQESIGTVQDLFHRFVLERLGAIYGRINEQLAEAGFCTIRELSQEATA